ncbi:MAG: hypothetical protein CSA74_02745 [Rhodobacterales bacterium]|nr:MAG: hypothetical protein CSA74_02745 [Rhodobacterales bacterium]
MARAGGVDRRHDPSTGPKTAFAALHGAFAGLCLWLAFGLDWPDPSRARLLAGLALLYWLRHLVTLFVFMKRRVEYREALGLAASIGFLDIGFLLLGAGALSGTARPFGWPDGLALALVLLGSALNTISEAQRHAWKQRPDAEGCYTGGLFALAMHINYFGDSLLFTGWALLTGCMLTLAVPALMTVLFIFYHIPPLDAWLAARYGESFNAYAAKTARFVPFLY